MKKMRWFVSAVFSAFLLSACGETGAFRDVGELIDTGDDPEDATIPDTGTSTSADSGM